MAVRFGFVRLKFASFLSSFAFSACASTGAAESSRESSAPAAVSSPAPSPSVPAMSSIQMPMMGGWHPTSDYGCLYFGGTQVTLRGSVEQAGPVVPRPHMMQGSQVVLRVDKKNYVVHLGPAWFVERQNFTLSKGDNILVEGRSISSESSSFVMATRVTKGAEVLTLRNEEGRPLWMGVWGVEGRHPASSCPVAPAPRK